MIFVAPLAARRVVRCFSGIVAIGCAVHALTVTRMIGIDHMTAAGDAARCADDALWELFRLLLHTA